MRAFRLAYDGRPYRGYQRQPDVPTVEDALFDALRTLDICDDAPASYSAAGRTDAGVSAIAQTVAFECPQWCSPPALNAELPRNIWAWASTAVPSDFHAGLAAKRRTYTYHLYAPSADDAAAREAASRLAGEHDFQNLTPDETGTVRRLDIGIDRDGDFLVITVSAGGFARQLVRRTVSLLEDIATGERELQAVDRVLGDADIAGPAGVGPAPAHPLLLSAVEYSVDFTVDETARADARAWFEERRVERITRGRVAASVRDGIG